MFHLRVFLQASTKYDLTFNKWIHTYIYTYLLIYEDATIQRIINILRTVFVNRPMHIPIFLH